MRCTLLGLFVLIASVIGAEERVVESRVVSAGLFKNGLAVVTREVTLNGAGTHLITDVPSPVHGTFWVDSDDDVEVRVTMRDMEVAPGAHTSTNLQEQLAGRKVSVDFKEPGKSPTAGTVLALERPQGDAAWARQYQQTRWYNSYGQGNRQQAISPFLVLDTQQGREYIDRSIIARVTVAGDQHMVTERRPVLLLTTKGNTSRTVRMSYLAKGLSWAPSYRMDISGKTTMTIEQKAIIKNELGAFAEAELFLISGFPSVEFGHVMSPLSLQQTWATFFQQLNTQVRAGHGGMGQMVAQQYVLTNAGGSNGSDMSAAPSGEGPDIHYQPAGKRTMAEGDSILLRVAAAKTNYDRIVEWIVPDTRRANGRLIQDHERNQNPDKYQDAVWDALRFKNPLPFPMTTGAAMVVGDGKFLGERTSFWVSQGEETTLQITKALSIRTRMSEQEDQGKRDVVYIGGSDYHNTTVTGELVMNNHRKESVPMVVRRRFSGELLRATGNPTCVLREEGAWSANKRNELTWNLTLKPGEERKLTYSYTIFVDR